MPQTQTEFHDYQAEESNEEDSVISGKAKTLVQAVEPQHYFKGKQGKEITCHDPNDRVDLLLTYLKSGKMQ